MFVENCSVSAQSLSLLSLFTNSAGGGMIGVGLKFKIMEKYSIEKAEEEASQMIEKIKSGEVSNFNEAEDAVTKAKEKLQYRNILVIDDVYSQNLVNILNEQHSDKEALLVNRSEDLETALAKIKSIDHTQGTAVLTDMFMPEKRGSYNPAEGLKIVQEMLEFYGVNHEIAKERIEKVNQVLSEYGDNIEKISRPSMGGGYSAEGERITQRIVEIFEDMENNPAFNNFASRVVGKAGNLYSLYSKRRYPPGFLEGKSEEELINSGILVRKDGVLDISEDYIKENPSKFRDYIVNGETFLQNISYALLWGPDGGLPLGVRVAEESHKKQIPFVVVSGGHGVQIENSWVFANYLAERGIIDNQYALDMQQDKQIDLNNPDAQSIVDQHSYFIISKRIEGLDGEKNKKGLELIAKSLESKIS